MALELSLFNLIPLEGSSPFLYFFFFVIAILYSSVGFGGGSSYLAILSLYGIDYRALRATALMCNITVVSGNISLMQLKGVIPWEKVLPLVLTSIPMAFIGGYIPLNEVFFFILLACSLFIAGILMIIQSQSDFKRNSSDSSSPIFLSSIIGGGVGLLSGMVGIGGGIFLSPVLHLIGWDNGRKIAATASVYILLNSISGLSGQFVGGKLDFEWSMTIVLIIIVFIGGQIGQRISLNFLSMKLLRILTAILVIFVAVRIFIKYI